MILNFLFIPILDLELTLDFIFQFSTLLNPPAPALTTKQHNSILRIDKPEPEAKSQFQPNKPNQKREIETKFEYILPIWNMYLGRFDLKT